MLRFTKKQWSKAQKHLGNALILDPTNPKIMFKLGAQHKLLASSFKKHPSRMRINNRKAAVYFRQSIAARPVYPVSWAYLAVTKEQLNVINREFWNSMEQSMRLGSWEPAVTFPVSVAGMAYYHIMPSSMRLDMAEFVQHGFVQHGIRLWNHLVKSGHLELACSLMKNQHLIDKFCINPDSKSLIQDS